MGGWCHPDISLEDVVELIKGFVDIIVLASGYQSSGLPAVWDPCNINKALQWGLFFEHVFRRLYASDDYDASIKELDAALFEIKSNPCFPQGLLGLSSVTLTRAKDFVVKHIIHTLPLKDAHLIALLTATIEMDLDELQRTEFDCLNVYYEKLMHQSTSCDTRCHSTIPDVMVRTNASASHSKFIIQELSERQAAVSRVLLLEHGLNSLSESASHMCEGISRNGVPFLTEEQFTECAAQIQWRSRNLSYLLDKRTSRLLSGAKLILSASKVQWQQIFERLKVSNIAHDDTLELAEILLLGCVSSRWTRMIEHFLSFSHQFLPISDQYQEVQSLSRGSSHQLNSEQESEIVEYLTLLLSSQLHLLWKLPPLLAAISIPSWSLLFGLYMSEIDKQWKGDSPLMRCCSCFQDEKRHRDCELGERIWCLYIFHVHSPHLIQNTNSP